MGDCFRRQKRRLLLWQEQREHSMEAGTRGACRGRLARRLDPCACACARAYVRGGGEHFSGREISLCRAGNPLDLIR